jgi:hypothetical protein
MKGLVTILLKIAVFEEEVSSKEPTGRAAGTAGSIDLSMSREKLVRSLSRRHALQIFLAHSGPV